MGTIFGRCKYSIKKTRNREFLTKVHELSIIENQKKHNLPVLVIFFKKAGFFSAKLVFNALTIEPMKSKQAQRLVCSAALGLRSFIIKTTNCVFQIHISNIKLAIATALLLIKDKNHAILKKNILST